MNSKDTRLHVLDTQIEQATSSLAKLQAEYELIKATPEIKTGRVLSIDELEDGDVVYTFDIITGAELFEFNRSNKYKVADLLHGRMFHDADTCNKYGEYMLLEQALRRAQRDDGGVPSSDSHTCILDLTMGDFEICHATFHEKISFNTRQGLDSFVNAYIPEQLKLLIMGA